MKPKDTEIIWRCIAFLVFCVLIGPGCQSLGTYPQRRTIVGDLLQKEKELGWRLLLDYAGGEVAYLNLKARSRMPIYTSPGQVPNSYSLGMASLHPDGSKITFSEGSGSKERSLVVFDVAKQEREVLLTIPVVDGPRWSSRGGEIAFQGVLSTGGEYALYIIRLKDRTVVPLVTKGLKHGEFLFCWAPDGRSIVFQDNGDNISIVDVKSKKIRRLDRGWFPTWSPDGKYIAYRLDGKDDPGYAIFDLQTGRKDVILSHKSAYRSLVWSPDSRYLAHPRARTDPIAYLFGEDFYGDLYVYDIRDRLESKLGSFDASTYPTDWGKSIQLK